MTMNDSLFFEQRWQVSAFCGKRRTLIQDTEMPDVKGNPAEVVLLSGWPQDLNQLQQQATTGPLPTTVFIVADSKRNNHYHIRWFNRIKQIQRCGHGTLAAAYTLWKHRHSDQTHIVFLPENGENIIASRHPDSSDSDISITLEMPTIAINQIFENSSINNVLNCRIDELYGTVDTTGYYIVVLHTEDELNALQPQPSAIINYTSRAIIAASLIDEKPYQLAFRYFAPQYGINEDQVTGSAARVLSHFYYQKTGRNDFCALQASTNGGLLDITYKEDVTTVSGYANTINWSPPRKTITAETADTQ